MMNLWVRVLLALSLLVLSAPSHAQKAPTASGEIKKGIRADGACAIVGMSAEQSQLTALQRARASAIEQAAGVSVAAATLVTNFTLAGDFIKTYARGFIVAEKVEWLPLGQYQKDRTQPPIPEYKVRIIADVYIPARKALALGLSAKLNKSVFRTGEKAAINVRTKREGGIAVFNIMADDRVALVFPNAHEPDNIIAAERDFVFPRPDAKVELEMQTLPGHKRDAEAFLVIAWDKARAIDVRAMMPGGEPMPFEEFFRRLSAIADHLAETILPYEVVAE